jgi:OmpR family response regulator RpaB
MPKTLTSGVLNSGEIHQEKILVVDDEANIRQILSTRLSMIGYAVVTAKDG